MIARLRARLARPLPWRVMRQRGATATLACHHSTERAARRCARRQTRRTDIGIYYDVFPAVTK